MEPLPPESLGGPRLGLAGDLQRRNGAVAVAMAQALGQQGWSIEAGAIERGLALARWPGRLEIRSYRGKPLLLDGAHNPPAALALRQELDQGELAPWGAGGRRWLIGIQRHKQGAAMLRALLASGDQAAITPLPEHASWSAAELAVACPELARQLRPVADPAEGLAWLHHRPGPGPGAGELASPEEGGPGATGAALPVVAGSLYLLGALIPWLDPAAAGPG